MKLKDEVAQSSVKGSSGKPAEFVAVTKDITEQKKVEKALREAEEKYRKTIVNANVGIIAYDPKGEVKILNPKMEEMTGFKNKEIPTLVNWFEKLYPNEEERRKVREKWFKRMSEKGEVKEGHAIITTKKGKHRNFLFNGVQLESGDSIAFAHDITERKKAEEKLLASEKKYRRLFKGLKKAEKQLLEERDRAQGYLDVASVMLVALDTEGRVTLLNRKGCDVLNCTAEKALGKNWFDTFLPKDTKDDVKKIFQSSIKGKKCLLDYNENYVISKSGEARLIAWHNAFLRNSRGRIIGTLSSGEDITEWKQAQQALADSEEKFRAISTYASDAILLVDKTDKVIYWNLAAEKIFGYKKEEIVGKKLDKIVIPPKFRRVHLELLKWVLDQEGQVSERLVEVTGLRKGGPEFPIELTISALKLKDASCMLEIIRDVSERKKMEDELKQERDKLEDVTENIGAGLTIISKDYRIVWANKFLRQVFGNVEEKTCYLTFHNRDTICPDCGAKKVFEGAAIDTHEFTVEDDKGNTQWIELTATPIKDKHGTVVAATEIAVVITERKQMQNKLAEYSERLEKLVEERTKQLKRTQDKLVKTERLAAIGELAAMVGHDLRNPLQAIENATYYLNNECARMPSSAIPPKAKEMLQVIGASVNYADKIVRDLHDFSATKKPSLKSTDINMLVKEALSHAKAPKNVEINTELSQLPEIKVDEDQMKRVFLNFIANGIQAMENGGTLTVSTQKAEGFVEISFKDTGVGIPQGNMDKIFSPFFTTKAKGMGVGLAICKKFVESHDGAIHVESEVDKGTIFTVKLPIRHKTEVENVARE